MLTIYLHSRLPGCRCQQDDGEGHDHQDRVNQDRREEVEGHHHLQGGPRHERGTYNMTPDNMTIA